MLKIALGFANASFFLFTLSAHAQMPHILKCRGDLPTYCLKKEKDNEKDQWKSVSNNLDGFSVRESDCLVLRSGVDREKPYVQFIPWAGIGYKKFPENYKNGLDLNVKSVGEDSLNIVLTGKNSKFKQHLNCSVAVDVK